MSARPRSGQAFGAYMLGDVLGRGGMGVVHRAEHTHLGREVALKLLAPEVSQSGEFRDRFLRESRLAAGLDHPNIITVYDAGEVDGVLYIAMQFVRGSDLATELGQRGPLSPALAVERLAQVGAALDAAHAAGLVHRDVKPANVMLEGDRCFLTDFGLTKLSVAETAGLTKTGVFLGTVHYAAPEQILGDSVDARTDVYALGAVLYECLTGARPFHREGQAAVFYAHLYEAPPRPSALRPELPAALDDVVTRAMAKQPGERFGSCGKMVAAARAALASAPADDRPTAPVTAPTPPPAAPLPPSTAAAPPSSPPTAALPPSLSAPPPPPPPPPGPSPSIYHAPPPQRRSGGFPIAALVALLAVVAVAVVGAVVLAGGDGSSSDDSGGSGDSSGSSGGEVPTPRVAGAPIPVGERPFGVAVAGGSAWVANNSSDTVARVPVGGGEAETFDVAAEPFGVAEGGDSVFVSSVGSNSVVRYDAETGEQQGSTVVESKPYFLTADDETVYVSNGDSDTVSRLSTATGETSGPPIEVGNGPRGIAVGGGAVWVANREDETVSRIVDGKVADTIDVGGNPVTVAFGEGAVWVANRTDNTVTRIDADDLSTREIRVGREPFGVAFGEGFIWVTNTASNTVLRLDPETGERVGRSIRVGRQPVGITVADGSVWVTTNDSGELTRIDPDA